MKLYKLMSLRNRERIEVMCLRKSIYCAKRDELNDPLEGFYTSPSGRNTQERQATAEIRARINQAKHQVRICSLTNNPSDLLMWSHYADGHRGIAVELDVPADHKDLHEVRYEQQLMNVDVQAESPDCLLRHILTTKLAPWGYESEHRFIVPEEDVRLDVTGFNPKICFGWMTSSDNRRWLAELAQEAMWPCRAAIVNANSGRIDVEIVETA